MESVNANRQKMKSTQKSLLVDLYSDVKDKDDFNQWFAYFQRQKAGELLSRQEEIANELPAIGYAAFMRWIDIFENPDKMEKIIKTKVDEDKKSELIDLAVGDDDEKYYEGIIREIALQMNGSSTSPQEFARLSANMNIARKELREIRSRRPKKDSKLGSIVDRIAEINAKQEAKVTKTAQPRKCKSTAVKTTSPEATRTTKKKKTISNTSKRTTKKEVNNAKA